MERNPYGKILLRRPKQGEKILLKKTWNYLMEARIREEKHRMEKDRGKGAKWVGSWSSI